MRFFVVLITLCYFLVPAQVYGDGLTAEKRAAIKKMLQLTGASEMSTLMGTAIAQNLIQSYKRSNPDIDPKAFDIINEEIIAAFHEEFVVKESFYPYIYPLYDNYLTLREIKEINRYEIRQEVSDDIRP